MTQALPLFPEASHDDAEDVASALDAGALLWVKGDRVEAIRWLRRAREFADDAGTDRRALELARVAADLTAAISSLPPGMPRSAPNSAAPRPPYVVQQEDIEQKRSKLPEPPAPLRKFTNAVNDTSLSTPVSGNEAAGRLGGLRSPQAVRTEPKSELANSINGASQVSSRGNANASSHLSNPRPQNGHDPRTNGTSQLSNSHPGSMTGSRSVAPRPLSSEPMSVTPRAHPHAKTSTAAATPSSAHSASTTPFPPTHAKAPTAAATPSSAQASTTPIPLSRATTSMAPSAALSGYAHGDDSSHMAGTQHAKPTSKAEDRLVSVSVRLERDPLDGTLHVIEVNENGRQDPENQAILVLSQSLWLQVTRPD